MNWKVKLFVAVTATVGVAIIVRGAVFGWHSQDLVRFFAYLAIAVTASSLKVSLPGIDGTMSVNFLFILIGILELSFPETLVIGCAATLVQCYWRVRAPVKPIHVVFNVAGMMAPAIAASYWVFYHIKPLVHDSLPLMLLSAACVYFLTNTVPVSVVIALAEQKSFRKIWSDCYFWSFPYYLVGAGMAGMVRYVNRFVGWQTSLLVLPVVYWIYRSYRIYLGRLEDEKRHVEDMASLHMRTIEALALAIDAKDHTTHDHLQRVRVYALEIGKELGLGENDLDALRAAALLHDIGKLAVPEHILNKPGRLTAEEFEKMKIHPKVGAEILEQVNFPYPVVPIVLAHHEKWDGTGYPNGLTGEQIPIGARILTTVDCFDALASDRQYRPALPLDQAMAQVAAGAGKDFDPRVVEVLQRRYIKLEQMAATEPAAPRKTLSTDIKVERGTAPAAGIAELPPPSTEAGFLSSIAAARQEAQVLFELSHELGNSLSLDETLSMFSVRMRRLVPFDAIVTFVCHQERLRPQHVSGDNFRSFSSLDIPVGQGLCGWVAGTGKPILNGNPAVEVGYDAGAQSVLASAVAVPLEAVHGIVGVLALYRTEADAFTRDDLRVLLAISSKVALCVENALKYEQAESSAVTDYLTGLPNARSLFLHLDRELARSRRTGTSVGIMVCDLNGFKAVNDRFGHLEGNRVLQVFSTHLRSSCREYDYVARMGGDEFVIVAPGLTREAALEKAQVINDFAIQAAVDVCGERILSAAVGTAFYVGGEEDAEQLLAEADRRMYVAKQEHHDRTTQKLPVSEILRHGARVN
jgi:diguanylate cyclase (GGDEF)-like protein/putative nucleotidyltransferase with HDIG domain